MPKPRSERAEGLVSDDSDDEDEEISEATAAAAAPEPAEPEPAAPEPAAPPFTYEPLPLPDFAKKHGLRRIVLARHSKTDKAADASPAADLARRLTPEGVDIAERARLSWGQDAHIGMWALCSRAERTHQTAQRVAPGVKRCVCECVYPDPKKPESTNTKEYNKVNTVFDNELKYAPLQAYLDHRAGLGPSLEAYAANVWDESMELYERYAAGTTAGDGTTFCIFSHAVFCSAIARFAARAFGLSEEAVLSTNVGEACAFVLTLPGALDDFGYELEQGVEYATPAVEYQRE
jgi:broad specificity phosphatase PhoE